DPVQTTTYTYNNAGAGWRFPADPAQRRADESWTEWRGYSNVTVTNGDGAQTHSTGYYLFQGLDGDRKVIAPAGPSDYKSVTVHGSSAGPSLSLTDSLWFAGRTYEESHRDNQAQSQRYVVHEYGFAEDTAVYTGTPDAMMVRETSTRTYDRLSDSTSDIATWREREIENNFNSGQASTLFGLPSSTEDHGLGGANDNTCTTYQYALNVDPANNRWVALQDDAAHYDATCANAAAANQDGDTQTFYDGATTLASNHPVDSNPTEVDTYTAAGAHTSTQANYDQAGRPVSATDARGHTTTTSYTPVIGWPTTGATVTTPPPDPSGVTGSATPLTTTTVTAPDHGQPTTITNPNGKLTTLRYDAIGRLTRVWKPAQQPTTNPASIKYTYLNPTDSTFVPDAPSGPPELQSQTLQTGSTFVTTYAYVDGLGQARETQAPGATGTGRIITFTRYDSSGYVEGNAPAFFNSAAPGSDMLDTDASNLVAYTDIVPDWAGRTIETQLLKNSIPQPDGDITTDYQGPDLTTVTDPDGNKTDTSYDVFGQTTTISQRIPDIDPGHPITTSYDYTDTHKLASITDNAGHVTSYTYDWAGRQTQAVDPDTGTTTTTYDADGDVKTTTDNNGQLLTHVYDRLDRPTALWLGAADTGTKLTSATYDTATLGKGLAATSTSWNGSAAYVTGVDSYDPDGNPTAVTTTIPAAEGALAGSYHTSYTYNAADQPLTITYPAVGTAGVSLPAETVTTGYTDQGLPNTLTSPLATYIGATFYANYGPLTHRTYGATGATLTATRDYTWNQTTGHLTGITTAITNAGTPATAQNDTYSYDPAGNVVEIASSVDGQQQCFGYDDLNRLTHAYTTTTASATSCTGAAPDHTGGPTPYDLAYSYDKLGDITSVLDTITSTTANYAYQDPNHVHAVTDVQHTGGSTSHDTYSYNPNGDQDARTVSGIAGNSIFDAQQHMTSMTTGGATTLFVYDAAGNRLLRKSAGDNVLYLPGQELHANGATVTPTRYYTSGAYTCAMRVGGNGTTGALIWLTADTQGSAQLAINASSGTSTQQRYLPFGAQRGPQGPPTGSDRSFLGHSLDPSGLLLDGARYYDSTLGIFLSPDPIVRLNEPQSLNAYGYSYNNPATVSDPTGLSPLQCPGGGPDGICAPGSSTTRGQHLTCDAACQTRNAPGPSNPPPGPILGPDGTKLVAPGVLLTPGGLQYFDKTIYMDASIDTIYAIADKYGLDVQDVQIVVKRAYYPKWAAATSRRLVITFSQKAFNRGELYLASTIYHELYHIKDLKAGLPYPATEDDAESSGFEPRARAATNEWVKTTAEPIATRDAQAWVLAENLAADQAEAAFDKIAVDIAEEVLGAIERVAR
ncbi:MAG TPA: RHS repeat-associated core domain-containing protein, partial [Mycobacterium sp.]|nr:RHS repeat-associated core domain-containing protein [Mycobacterium sp.]